MVDAARAGQRTVVNSEREVVCRFGEGFGTDDNEVMFVKVKFEKA